jgi:hypothetical protein
MAVNRFKPNMAVVLLSPASALCDEHCAYGAGKEVLARDKQLATLQPEHLLKRPDDPDIGRDTPCEYDRLDKLPAAA